MNARNRGRWIVAVMIVIALVGHVIFVVLPDSQNLTGSLIGCVVLVAVLYALWRGYGWARWLLTILCAFGLVVTLWVAFHSLTVVVALKALQFVVILGLLCGSPSVNQFLISQRASRRKS